jgi:hypothetical protein
MTKNFSSSEDSERTSISEPPVGSAPHLSSTAFMAAEGVGQRCLALVCELERSLRSAQAALLAIDAERTEQCTGEQVRLCRELKILMSQPLFPYATSPWDELRRHRRQDTAELAAQLAAAATRVQHLARVQTALLRRSQRFLGVMANWMKGPDSEYVPTRAAGGMLRPRNPIHQEF